METQKVFLKDEDGEEVDVHLYRSMIGLFMYLTSSRPDIMFAVRPPESLPCNCNVLPILIHQSLHPYLLANQLAQLEVEHLVQLVCTSSSSPCDTRSL
ncbi:hypothetical protein Tco_0297885 [Tanacetum coccineum]